MNLLPLRTAVIAGSCAVALSFAALPAYADDATGPTDSTTPPAFMIDPAAPVDTTTETPAEDPAPEATDDTATDDSTTGDDAGASDSATPAPTETPAPALPKEKHHAKQAFEQTVFLPKQIQKHGIHVKYSGLTPKAIYQPYYNGGQSGGELGKAKRANAKGVIDFVYHFGKSEKWATTLGASFGVGLLGQSTDLRLEQQVEVKYDSDVTLTTERHGKSVHLVATVDKAGKSGGDKAWKKVAVHFQKKADSTWVTVKTVKTNAKGVAKATVKASRTAWRAVVESGSTVAGTTTKAHKR